MLNNAHIVPRDAECVGLGEDYAILLILDGTSSCRRHRERKCRETEVLLWLLKDSLQVRIQSLLSAVGRC